MADRVPRVGEAPAFNSNVFTKALDEKLGKGNPPRQGDPYLVFSQASPESLPPFIGWVRNALRNTVNALTEFTADLKNDVDRNANRLNGLETRVSVLEEAPDARPFP